MGGIRNYLIVTASYWSFTLTDGALRMLVLLHFYTLGYTPFMLASLFLLYETAGIFAHLDECSDTQIRRPWIFRVKNQFTLGAFDATSCRTILLLISTKRPVRLDQ